MNLSSKAQQYLLPASKLGKFINDDHDIDIADLVQDWKEMDKIDVGIVGIPFDTSVMQRRGCRFGPNGIREALAFSTSYEPGLDVDLSKDISIADFGNIDVMQTDVLETHRRVELVLTEIYKSGVTPVILGGDHGLTYPNAKALMNSIEGNIGVIMFDGHLDLRTDTHGEISSGTPFRRLIDEPERNPLKPQNLVEVGINSWHNSKFYMDYARDQGISVIPARQVHKRGIEDVILEALEIAGKGTEAIFLSFDIDGLDFGAAPGTCSPNPGGLTSYQALEAVWMAGQHKKCRGMDILEVAPSLDLNNLTSQMGAALAMNFIGATKKRLR